MKPIVLFVCLAMACVPKPAPSPTLHDAFTSYVANCTLRVVTDESPVAFEPVEWCLGGNGAADAGAIDASAVSACLLKAADHYDRNTVACVVRDRGAEAMDRTRYGGAPREVRIADAARAWILAERIGYR